MNRSANNTNQDSIHIFLDEWNRDDSGSPSNPVLYSDLHEVAEGKCTTQGLKRTIEILGSALLLILSLPPLLVILFAVEARRRRR